MDSFTDEELLLLRKQLQDMAQEKTNLALQLGEQKGQLNILQKEIQKLKVDTDIYFGEFPIFNIKTFLYFKVFSGRVQHAIGTFD